MSMDWDTHDLICAIASATGGAARGIVRVSGGGIVDVLSLLFQPSDSAWNLQERQRATALDGRVSLTGLGRSLPATLYVWPTSHSYTREPMGELHTLGSGPLLQAVLSEFYRHGVRAAHPGEFTLRAFLGGRLDLAQVEAVAAVIDAGGAGQLHAALSQLAGGLSGKIQDVRDELVDVCADLEAGLDFAEEDISFLQRSELSEALARSIEVTEELLAQLDSRAMQQPSYRAVLVGQPNVGKSSLFNALVGRAAALVSTEAGTTRDYLTAVLEIAGSSIEVIDTAGWDRAAVLPNGDTAGKEVLRRAQHAGRQQAEQADLVLLCLDGSRCLSGWEQEQLAAPGVQRITVITKCDLLRSGEACPHEARAAVRTSAMTGEGIAALQRRIAVALGLEPDQREADIGGRSVGIVDTTAARCRESLTAASEALRRALDAAARPAAEELVAVELRLALEQLGQVVGAVYSDDILDRIFSRFCIGK